MRVAAKPCSKPSGRRSRRLAIETPVGSSSTAATVQRFNRFDHSCRAASTSNSAMRKGWVFEPSPLAYCFGLSALRDYFELAVKLLHQALAVLGAPLVVPNLLYLSFGEGVEPPRNLFHAQLVVAGDGKAPVCGHRDAAIGAHLRLACGLLSIVERHAGERFGPLPEEALVSLVPLLKHLEDPARKLLVGIRLTLHALRNGPSYGPGEFVVSLAGGDPVLSRYPGALLGGLRVALGDLAQVLEVRLGHRGRGHLIDTSVGSGRVQFQTRIFTVHPAQLNIRVGERVLQEVECFHGHRTRTRLRSANGRVAAIGAAEHACATRRGEGPGKKPRLSSAG